MKTSSGLEIQFLGRANVNAAGAPMKFPKRAAMLSLLALLILHRGKPITRTYLAYTLFPDEDEERAAAELRRYLYLTNKALPPRTSGPWLIVEAETVRWNASAEAFIDVLEFERLAGDASTYTQAVALYAGDLLEDVYDDWVVAWRERLRSKYTQVLADLIERHSASREHKIALTYAHLLLAVDPWSENVVRQVMSIRYASGDSAGALVEYERFVRRLRDEMATTPMPETSALRHAIVRNEAIPGSVDEGHADPAGTEGKRGAKVLPFFGRDDERALARMRWDRAARGFGGVLVVGGEAGIGKTRLVGEIARAAEKEGTRVFSGSTSAPEAIPYQCIATAFRSALSVIVAHPPDRLTVSILARVLPELASSDVAAPKLERLDPEREVARLFDAIAKLAVHLASPRPLLLIFEDLHWASGATLDAIAAIARRIDRSRVLVLATYREEEASASHALRRLIDALGIERRVTSIHLDRFDRASVLDAIARIDGLPKMDEALAERLYAVSEGNALFLHEAVFDALDASGGRRDDSLQPGIGNVIATRILRLGEDARTIAEIAAICGQGCTFDIVRDVSGMESARALDAFDELLDRRLVREAGAREGFDYVFTHHLIGSSIYERVEPPLRARRHARIAHVLEQRAGRGPEIVRDLARHYDRAGFRKQSARWYGEAARDAAAVYASEDAVDFATRALDCEDDSAKRIDLLFLREENNARRGARERQARDLDSIDAMIATAELRCRASHRRVLLLDDVGDRVAEAEAIAALRKEAEALGDERWRGLAAIAQARMLVAVGRYGEGSAAARDALARLEAPDTILERIGAYAVLIDACVATGDLSQVDTLIETAQDIARAAGDRASADEILKRAIGVAVAAQRFDRAKALAKESVARCRAVGDRVGEARALANVATACVRLSLFGEARAANLEAVHTFEEIGDGAGLARTLMNLGALHTRCGDFQQAREYFAAARVHQIRLGDERACAASLLNESFVVLWLDRAAEARGLARSALETATAIGHAAYRGAALANLGAAERDLGNFDAALDHMETGLALQLELGRMPDAVSDLADAALTYARIGNMVAAKRLAETALAVDPSWTAAAVFPPYPGWIVACIFHWIGEPRAPEVLAQASELALSFMASIDVPELRDCFAALPFVGGMEEAQQGRWPSA